jgi:hypothetical protein
MKQFFSAAYCLILVGFFLSSCGKDEDEVLKPEDRKTFEDGLVMHFDFTNGAQDVTGNGFDPRIYGTPSQKSGARGEGLFLNAEDEDNGCGQPGGDFFMIPSMADMWADGFTVAAWVSFTEIRYYERILDFGNGIGETYGDNFIFGRYKSTNDIILESWVSTDSAYNRSKGRLLAPDVIKNGELQFFAASVSPSGEMKIYVDGELVASRTDGNPIKNVRRSKNYLGHSAYCYLDPDFKGLFDEIWVYNRVVSADEIKGLYVN